MHRLLGSMLALALAASHAAAAGISDGDRQRLLAHLEMTEAWLVSEVTGRVAKIRRRRRPCHSAV